MSLVLDSGVEFLLRRLLQMTAGTRLLLPSIDSRGALAQPFQSEGMKITGLSAQESSFTKYMKDLDYNDKQRVECGVHEHLQMFDPHKERYHYGFLFPGSDLQPIIQDNGQPILVSDHLRQWHVSRHYPDYTAPLHLMLLEMMLRSILPGGYMAAVLPKGWLAGKMRYNKWLQEQISTVAKIELPLEAIQRWFMNDQDVAFEVDHNHSEQKLSIRELTELPDMGQQIKTIPFPVTWSLYIWHKTVSEQVSRGNQLLPLTRRYSTFAIRLRELEDETLHDVLKVFRKHDWYRYSVKPWLKIIGDLNNATYAADNYDAPPTVNNPKEMRVLRISESNKPSFQICKNLEEIFSIPLAAHCKLGPPVKVYTYSPGADAALQDLKESSGFNQEELKKASDDYNPQCNFLLELRARSLIENQEWLLSNLTKAGLIPCLLEQDSYRLRKQQKWLDIQLCPIERVVRMPSLENGTHWETMYEDTGIRALYPQLYRMWEQRAKRMRLDAKTSQKDDQGNPIYRWNFPFQFEDEIIIACKQSVWDTNQMGLGKTREVLFSQLLLGVQHSLIIAPARLLGVWQDEIEKTIANYVRVNPRNWMRKIMSADYQIIQHARDCLPANLKTFNLISYENMSKVPKDALFFKCPRCEFIVCSPLGRYKSECEKQLCPRCNEGKPLDPALRALLSTGNKDTSHDPIFMLPEDHHWEKVQVVSHHTTEYDRELRQLVTKEVQTKVVKNVHLKWTFAGILRNRFSFRVAEESNYVNNPKANRSVAMNHGRARTRIALTGTPVRGYPRSVVNVMNWTFKREVFPDYRSPGKSEIGAKKFERKYGYYVEREGKSKKLLPKINQPEMFQQEMAPFMLRRLRLEPAVAACVPPKVPEINSTIVPMDDQHKAYYNLWLEKFAEWWALKRKEEDNQENARVVNDLLVKLGYLINVSSIPHFMLENLSGEGAQWAQIIGPYQGNQETKTPVAKFKKCTHLIEKYIEAGDKTIIFTWRRANIVLGRMWCKTHQPQIYSTFVDGTISNERKEKYNNRSEKDFRIDKFRFQDYHTLWAGIQTMKEGFNIPEANRGIFLEYTWEPADWQQALARMLRPAQKKQVHGTFLCHQGSVDEYIAALVQIKARSAEEGVDYQTYDDFKISDIPDFQQYANAIVDGTTEELRTKMWSVVEDMKRQLDEEE